VPLVPPQAPYASMIFRTLDRDGLQLAAATVAALPTSWDRANPHGTNTNHRRRNVGGTH